MDGGHREPSFEGLCDIVGPIAASYGMKRVYLFGSRARGDFDDDSDYDFCVITGDDCTLFTLSGFLIRLKEALGTEVDVVARMHSRTTSPIPSSTTERSSMRPETTPIPILAN